MQSPGTLGLNTQDQDSVQDPRYATQALNCVISKNGLLESRQGSSKLNGTAATGTPTFDVVYSYMEDDGTEHIILAGGNKLWEWASPSMVDLTGALTVTSDDWQFHTYKGEVFGYNGVDAPIYWDGSGAAFLTIASKGTAAGIVSSAAHLSAFGRSWVVDTTSPSTINYSDLLVPEDFTNGSAGTIDLNSVWAQSNDTIVALAVHNNNLVIFCQRSIVIYGSADYINNLYLVEVISSNGCIARDSIQTVGNDIFYLANDGVRSLSRTVLQDNMPMGQISSPIRDDMIHDINGCDTTKVRSTYNEQQGFYLINFPNASNVDVVWCCDVRLADQGIFRWTDWNLQAWGLATSNSTDDALYFGMAGGFLGKYDEYLDLASSYVMKYRSAWTDIGAQTSKCIWKKALWYIASLVNVQATTTWSFDFNETEDSQSKDIVGSPAPVYGTAVYGTDYYGGNYEKQQLSYQLSKSGSIIRLGFQATVNGGKFAFNKIDLFFKAGRIR